MTLFHWFVLLSPADEWLFGREVSYPCSVGVGADGVWDETDGEDDAWVLDQRVYSDSAAAADSWSRGAVEEDED
ncbi:hypothetical protein ABGV42_28805 [Paenibacillus pabuli]